MARQDTIVAIIVAAGKGERIGGADPKQFIDLGGCPLVEHSRMALAAHSRIDRVVVVVAPDQADRIPDARPIGGATRRESVRNALEELADSGVSTVLIHDAARPFVPPAVIDRLLDALDAQPGAVPVLPITDTLARGDSVLTEGVSRDHVFRLQTPQAFRFDAILDAHRRWPATEDATDDAGMAQRTGHDVMMVEGSPILDKITYPADLALAEARIAQAMETRSASGFDVHRLEAGEELWLGGVLIPHDKGLSGHSDADVALHALTDALLGTIAAGDIGTHFPPSDPQWKGADSAQFLQHAAALIAERGGRIDFVDLTLMCEAPKIGPHRAAMQTRIAALLGLQADRVSIKATTTERLGFTGRGEGIAAQAIATVSVPR
ncbi:bifunctional 2-C-methyl-D-erythritol 4-phosphate cytidylyltransferase/2-C-methyl-D-erythritol 2,4-cyclodiphosphate synthase [Sphingomonas oligophenolica]|uniref:Bifunctional enzyme IspD/IspF n=1 Tax=Sphingomonas oligophenolica TaxID=301154 RepID=A0A502CNE7_9SPHN|nr:bifunctional 2-C-methyl-D-erythritol 4-phosphate cytidylyltransferase/2-C-methyl-D-erythritol 2,4-cyclodiphosphate synthase [Sphingomonas oligophenolica]TPG14282.1 bifunctional 2-C-methyl-D-erythritol 4-phosphate cytidylyltransferase/2-C-methyl-D-erythritol 2,4-cyclodiphosphate synthase [Sphingomonas oligophenolica]